jgi:uncharacterized protein with HEPN domain
MTRHDENARLRHMLDYAREAVHLCQGRARGDLDRDRTLALALERLIEILGEAARSVSTDRRARMPALPWREVIGTRDWLAHGYPVVDYDILWDIVRNVLPPLIESVEQELDRSK